jgi:hypothetical protein
MASEGVIFMKWFYAFSLSSEERAGVRTGVPPSYGVRGGERQAAI